MSVLERRRQVMKATRMISLSSRQSFANLDSDDDYFCAPTDLEDAREGGEFTSIISGKGKTNLDLSRPLRIKVDADYDLQERYMSSEEEPSPSPDSESASHYADQEDELFSLKSEEVSFDNKENEEPLEAIIEECIPEIALAVPIMAIGRPKLVDISSLAPMHKRKRANTDKTMLSRSSTASIGTQPFRRFSEQPISPSTSTRFQIHRDNERAEPTRSPLFTPTRWLESAHGEKAAENEASYLAFDPVDDGTARPKSMRRDSINVLRRRLGSVARARKQISRRSSRDSLTQTTDKPLNKKLRRMQARAADERVRIPTIPDFPSDRM